MMTPVAGGHDATLYVTPPARPGAAAFHADAAHGELWVGPLPGVSELASALDLKVRAFDELSVPDDALIAGHAVVGAGSGARLGGRRRSPLLARTLAELRIEKDAWELDELRAAVNHTIDGFAAVRREIPRAVEFGGERWLQGTFDRHARTVGQAPGYASIVGSGANAPVLHWVRAEGAVEMQAFATAAAYLLALLAIALIMPNSVQILSAYEPVLYTPKRPPVLPAGLWRPLLWRPTPAWMALFAAVAAVSIIRLTGKSEFLYWQF